MGKHVPKLGKFQLGQKVEIGDSNVFAIQGVISEIVTSDANPIKVNAGFGQLFELSLEDFGSSWRVIE